MATRGAEQVEPWFRAFVMEKSFLHRYPHYAYILAQMVPFHDPTLDVMAVSYQKEQLYLHVNVDFFMRYPQYLRGVLLHEVHHVVLGHLTRPHLRNVAFPHLMNVAMEISANEYIEEPLPGQPLTVKQFADVGIIRGQSTRERYEKLCEAMKRGQSFPQSIERCVDTHHDWGVGFPEDSTEPSSAQQKGIRTEQPIQRVIRRAIAQGEEFCHEHKQLQRQMAGKDPGHILEELEEATEEPIYPIDWRTALLMFVASIRIPRHTYTRPNRRHPQRIGVVPGRMYAPGQGDKPSLVVAIDTSASMGHDDFLEIGRHLRLLANLVNITIVECDVKIQRVYRFEQTLDSVQGRGGTDLRPVFAPEFLRSFRPDGLIYFTDGDGPFLAEAPSIRTLWVLTSSLQVDKFSCPWGKKVHFHTPSIISS